jgi:hypothetical protein
MVANKRRMTSDTFIALPPEIDIGQITSRRGPRRNCKQRVPLFADLSRVNAMPCEIADEFVERCVRRDDIGLDQRSRVLLRTFPGRAAPRRLLPDLRLDLHQVSEGRMA